jgi:hypothetical protein
MGDVPSLVEFEWRFDSHLGGLLAIINSALAATSRVTTGASLTWAKSRTPQQPVGNPPPNRS